MEHNGNEQRHRQARNAEMAWAVKAGITDGARPKAFITREEAAQMIYRALEHFFAQIICILNSEMNE